MAVFILRRLLLGLFVLFGVVLVTFALTRVIPSDPAAKWVGDRATPKQIAKARVELGLDKPIYIQLGKYISSLAKGNLGYSLRSHQPVSKELKTYLPATIELVLISTIFAMLIGIPLGLISANKKNRILDHLSRFFSVGAVSLPVFWVGLFLQLLFFRKMGWLPLGDQLSMEIKLFEEIPHITGFLLLDCILKGNFLVFKDAVLHMILPGITIAMFPLGIITRMSRSALLEILDEDYIMAARSYGLPERLILLSYALKNALGPIATVATLSIGVTLVNTFLVEAIFSWPGIGSYTASAVLSLDYPAIMGVTIFSACSYVVLNLIADIIIALDPRVRV